MGDIYHTGDTYAGSVPIDDTQTTATNTWSAQKINNEIDTKASKSIITSNDVFDPTKAYAAEDWLIHNNILYEVKAACTGVTPPNTTYYKVKNLHDLQGDINKLKDATLVGNIVIVASWAQVQTALTTKVSSMKNNTIENMILACSAAFTQMPYGGYFATQVSKTNNNLWSALLHGYSGEVKHISYNSGEYLFDDIGSDMFAWKDLGTFDVTGTSQSQAFVISGRIHEFLIAYGRKNSAQAYGGGTVVIKNHATDNVCCLPVYEGGRTTLIGMVVVYVSAANTITYYASNVASGYSLLIKVYYR
jgi:hypothetical protein